jgi:hypothetical protein
MYNLRYHIASLVAVFLALSVGLVLGSIVVERGTIDRQREALVTSLQKEFVGLNAENKALKAQVEADSEFLNALVPYVVAGSLTDRTVLVVANEGRADGLSSAQDAIRAAGGEPVVILLQAEGLGLDQTEVSAAAAKVLGTAADDARLLESVTASLAAEWSAPGPRPLTEALSTAGVLRADDLPTDSGVGGLVVLAAWEKRADAAALGIAAAMSKSGVAAVGAEQLNSSTGVAQAFAAAGLSAVNDLGSSRGEYSLARLLTGEVEGFFGVGTATDAPFAPLPSEPAGLKQ